MGKEKERQKDKKNKKVDSGTFAQESDIIVLEEEDLTEVDLTLLEQHNEETIVTSPSTQSDTTTDGFDQEYQKKPGKIKFGSLKTEVEDSQKLVAKKEENKPSEKKKIRFGRTKQSTDSVALRKDTNKDEQPTKIDDTKNVVLGRNVRQTSQRDLEQVNEAVVEEIDEAEFEKAVESAKPYDANFVDFEDTPDAKPDKELQKSKKSRSKDREAKMEKDPSPNEESYNKGPVFLSEEDLLKRLRKIKSKKKLLANNNFLLMILELDKLLGHLPKDKIETFARSSHYSTYAVLMEEVFNNLSEKSQ